MAEDSKIEAKYANKPNARNHLWPEREPIRERENERER